VNTGLIKLPFGLGSMPRMVARDAREAHIVDHANEFAGDVRFAPDRSRNWRLAHKWFAYINGRCSKWKFRGCVYGLLASTLLSPCRKTKTST